MKLNKIYLHVGMQKTATSSIQQSLSVNKEFLEKNSILYPSSWSNWHVNEIGALLYKEQEEQRRNILHRKNFSEIDRINIIEKIKKEILKCDCESLVISAESTILYSKDGLFKLRNIIQNDLNIKSVVVIISVRNIIDFMNSYVQQLIKSSFRVDYNDLVNKIMYENQITKFEEVFGQENLIVYSFEEAKKHPFGVVGYFFEKIGICKEKVKEIKIIKTNEGISELACEVINYINITEPFVDNEDISKNRQVGDTQLLQKLSGKKFVMDEIYQKSLLKNSLRDTQWLKHNYGIDYTSTKIIKKNKSQISEATLIELKEIFPKLNHNIQKIIENYVKEKLENTRFYEIENKRNLKRCLNIIQKVGKNDI